MKYEISIRVTLPEEIAQVIRQEKQRFITEYGSNYESEPHITLYLDSYTKEGLAPLVKKLRKMQMKPFTIFPLFPKVQTEVGGNRNFYLIDIRNKKPLIDLHDKISAIANPHRSPFLRERTRQKLEQQGILTDGKRENLKTERVVEEVFDPHITLGEAFFDKPQVDINNIQKNLSSIEGTAIIVTSISIFFFGKEDGEEKFSLLDEIKIPFQNN